MTPDHSIPPSRDLPPGRLAGRREHLLSEIAEARRRPVRARRRVLPALIAAVAVAVLALLLVSPWQGAPSLTDRALAAIGDAPVLHIVTEREDWFPPRVDIETGEPRRQTIQTEIWFDEGRGLKKTVQRLGGVLMDDTLETPEGGFTRGGPLITCAWIAAHPVEATKLRVSCNENMENGTTPRKIPEKPPVLEPTLAGFVDGYRAALDSGRAHEIGRDTIDGRAVIWLRFPPPATPRPAGAPAFPPTDVAVDAATYRPVRIRWGDASSETTVHVAETLPYDEALFPRPVLAPPGPSSGRNREKETIEFRAAARLLARAPLWLGPEWEGFRLVGVLRLELSTGYGPLSGREITFADAVRLTYEAENGRTLELEEATTCQFGLRWTCGVRDPREGEIRRHVFVGYANAKLDGLYLSIRTWGTDVDALALARALVPVPEGERWP